MSRKNYHIVAIAIFTVLITYMHFGVMRQFSPLVVLEELYYLPLLLAVFSFGLAGVLLTWLFVSAAYLPFFFGNWTTTFPALKNEGTCLGMPISRKVIEAHAGSIAINSKQGVGTEVKIWLPYKKRQERMG
jgi:hypothetical protein